jgi:hypothetical protein
METSKDLAVTAGFGESPRTCAPDERPLFGALHAVALDDGSGRARFRRLDAF